MNLTSLTSPKITAGTQNTSPIGQAKNYFQMESVISDRASRHRRLEENNRLTNNFL